MNSIRGNVRSTYVLRLWRGELSLATTFLLIGVLGSLTVRYAFDRAFFEWDSRYEEVTCIAAYIAWTIFVLITTFRSAARFRRRSILNQVLGASSQLLVSAAFLISIGVLIRSLPGYGDDNRLKSIIDGLKAQMSQANTQNVKLTDIKQDNLVTRFEFTYDQNREPIGQGAVEKIKRETAKSACANHVLRRMIFSSDDTVYTYTSPSGDVVMSYHVRWGDCLGDSLLPH